MCSFFFLWPWLLHVLLCQGLQHTQGSTFTTGYLSSSSSCCSISSKVNSSSLWVTQEAGKTIYSPLQGREASPDVLSLINMDREREEGLHILDTGNQTKSRDGRGVYLLFPQCLPWSALSHPIFLSLSLSCLHFLSLSQKQERFESRGRKINQD